MLFRSLPNRLFIVGIEASVEPRIVADGQPSRSVLRISDAELEAGIIAVLTAIVGDTRESLIRNSAQSFGFRRVGPDIRSLVGGAVTRLLAREELKIVGEMIEIA